MEENIQSTKKSISIREAVAFGWTKVRERILFFMAVTFISVFLAIIITLPLDLIAGLIEEPLKSLVLSISWILYSLIYLFLLAGLMAILLKTIRGENSSLRDFLNKKEYLFSFLVGSFLYYLIVAIGFLLFIIPGIFLMVKLSLYPLLIVDKNMGPIVALKESYQLTKGFGWKLFLFNFIISPLIWFIGAMVLLVGIFVAMPISFLAWAFLYDRIITQSS